MWYVSIFTNNMKIILLIFSENCQGLKIAGFENCDQKSKPTYLDVSALWPVPKKMI